MTRAVGNKADFVNGKWTTKYGLSTVNTAGINGALKYIMTETIDFATGYTNSTEGECGRKNWVNYIHFYKVKVCNPDAALWWFNIRKAGYGGDSAAYNYGEYGQYLTMDGGECHGEEDKFCDYLHGTNNKPKLGPYVGWQDVSKDVRNPTPKAYWYSLPGECPSKTWAAGKSDDCIAKEPTGLCAAGVVPDGVKCTWQYELIGQVNIDDLAGITSIENPATGKNFVDAQEYCLAGNKEFVRDAETFDFVSGLDFWKDPLDEQANLKRIDALLALYATGANNIPLPAAATLQSSNPRCYISNPLCFKNNAETCTRNTEQLCVACDQVSGGCSTQVDATKAFKVSSLAAVQLPSTNNGTTSASVKLSLSLPLVILGLFITN
jgi:hypothetical protein